MLQGELVVHKKKVAEVREYLLQAFSRAVILVGIHLLTIKVPSQVIFLTGPTGKDSRFAFVT
jgi:hypothetical protein